MLRLFDLKLRLLIVLEIRSTRRRRLGILAPLSSPTYGLLLVYLEKITLSLGLASRLLLLLISTYARKALKPTVPVHPMIRCFPGYLFVGPRIGDLHFTQLLTVVKKHSTFLRGSPFLPLNGVTLL